MSVNILKLFANNDVKDIISAFLIGVIFLYGSWMKPSLPDWLVEILKHPIWKFVFFVIV